MPSEYRKTRSSGLYIRHSRACPSFADEQRRCRCEPSYRTHRRIDGKMRWSPVFKDRASAMSWDGHEAKAERAVRAIRREGQTFGEVAGEWWALVEAGTYARRRGRSKKLSDTTIADYRGVLYGAAPAREAGVGGSLVLVERCGRRPIAALDDSYWQSIVDELVRDGKSYSRIATYLAVIRHVYAYARRPNLRIVTNDPTRELQMPANDGEVRERVATADEAAALIEALPVLDSAGALSWEAVLEIRASSQSAVALADRFGVSDALVGKVRRGELYKTPEGRRSRETGDRAGWGLAFYTGMRGAARSAGHSGSRCSGTPTRSWSPSPRAMPGRAGAFRWSLRSSGSCARSGCAPGGLGTGRSSRARSHPGSGRHVRTRPGRRAG